MYGREFAILTDHKPLTSILGPKQGVPPLAAARLQRWSLILAAYRYTIQFKSTKDHGNADGLSRLPLDGGKVEESEATIFNITQMESLPVQVMELEKETQRDPILRQVLKYTKFGWPAQPPPLFKPYYHRKMELSVEGNCLLWGVRVIVPKKLQDSVLEELHQSHPGIVRMKSVARSYFWWPKIDDHIEVRAKSCTQCKSVQSNPPPAPLHPWVWPTKPWERVHLDFAGPFLNKMFFVVIDSHSKWPEVIIMSSITAENTISELRKLFQDFVRHNGIKHIRSAPYHPSTNGQAKRFIRTFKGAMKAQGTGNDRQNIQNNLSKFLLTYRSTPHGVTGRSPGRLFLKRELRTKFDLLRPNIEERVQNNQADQEATYNKRSKFREFREGQNVMVRNYREGTPWVIGKVKKRLGRLLYEVVVEGKEWRRHVDQITELGTDETKGVEEQIEEQIEDDTEENEGLQEEPRQEEIVEEPVVETQNKRRYPDCIRRPPDRYS